MPASARAPHSCTRKSPVRTHTRSRTTRSCTRRRTRGWTRANAIRFVSFAAFLKREGLLGEVDFESIAADVDREIAQAAERARAAAKPAKDTATLYVYSPSVDPAADSFATQPVPEGKPDTMVAAINRTLKDEMARDPRIVVFGEDVADCSREGALGNVPGQRRRVQGDARPAARLRQRPRLQRAARRGEHHRTRHRHRDARPETGRRDPVLRLHLAGDDAAPRRDVDAQVPLEQRLLVPGRRPCGDRRLPARAERRITASPARASSPTAPACESYSRRTPTDAAGLLRTAIRCDDPVLFLEHKHLYRQTYNKGANTPGRTS